MNAPVHAKSYNLPLRSKLLDWLETSPQKVATAKQWYGMINNLKNVRNEEIDRAVIWALFDEDEERFNKEDLINEATSNLAECHITLKSYWNNAFRPSLEVKTVTDKLPKRVEKKAKRFVEKAQICYQHPSIG